MTKDTPGVEAPPDSHRFPMRWNESPFTKQAVLRLRHVPVVLDSPKTTIFEMSLDLIPRPSINALIQIKHNMFVNPLTL